MHLKEGRAGESVFRKQRSSREVTAPATGRRDGLTAAVLITVLTILAAALRFWRLSDWGFDSDEVFLLRDSLDPSFRNPRPLLYFLNHYVVAPLLPLDEFGLRLLPAIFGVLAIPAFYLITRRLVGTRAALFGALLITLSPLHLHYSQFARYWSLVFLLSSVYPYAIYIGLRERNRGALALGLVTGVLASLAHPASIILVGGLLVWMLPTYLRREQLAHLWGQRSVRWGALIALILVGVIAVRFIPILEGWLYHDTPLEKGVFLLHLPHVGGMRQISFLLGFVESLTFPLVLIGLAGIWLLWKRDNRPLALLLVSLFIFQLTFILLVMLRSPVSTFYLLPAVPVLFIGAGVLLDRLAAVEWDLRPRWLLPAMVMASVISAGAPTLISQYLDGRRWDFRGVARWLEGRVGSEDLIFSDQPSVLAHYLPRTTVRRLLADTARLAQSVRTLDQAGRGGVLWIVTPAPSHAFRTNPNLDRFNRWTYDYCELRNSVGTGRVDFRQQYLLVFRCPPEAYLKAGSDQARVGPTKPRGTSPPTGPPFVRGRGES
jgi:4-amino-4-deoxy-L-arabinose transferase-like glycosyltransferase